MTVGVTGGGNVGVSALVGVEVMATTAAAVAVAVDVSVGSGVSVRLGNGIEVGSPREQPEQRTPICHGTIENVTLQRGVHGQEDQPVVGHERQLVLQPGELPLPEPGGIATVAADVAGIALPVALMLDVIEHHEQRITHLETVIGGP